MTLKSSLSEARGGVIWQLTLKTIRRFIWLPMLAMLGFGLAMPVISALIINDNIGVDWAHFYNGEPLTADEIWQVRSNYAHQFQMTWQLADACVLLVGGLLASLVLFRYLQARRQVDFYHSLPVRREQYFCANVLAGLLIFLVPYLAAHLLNLLLLAGSGWLPYLNMGLYAQAFLFDIFAYLLIFACGTLAVMLSGSLPAAIKVLAVSFGICPLILATYIALGDAFLSDYVELFGWLDNVLLRASAPEFVIWVSCLDGVSPSEWLTVIILPAALLAASLALYKRRRSEAAGATLAYRWQLPLFKYPLVFCGGLLVGLFFYAVSSCSGWWLYLGAAFGTTLLTVLLDIFIKLDFKAIKRSWRSALPATLVVFLILSAYVGDWFGYDAYLPRPEQLKSVYVNSNVLNNFTARSYGYYDTGYERYWNISPQVYIDQHNMIELSEPESIAAFCRLLERKENTLNDRDYYIRGEWLNIVYQLNSGRMMARDCWVPTLLLGVKDYEAILDGEDFRRSYFREDTDLDRLDLNEIDTFGFGGGSAATETYLERLPQQAQKQFFETLEREYASLSGAELLYTLPVASITTVSYESKKQLPTYVDYERPRYRESYIYPGMTESIALLQQLSGGALTPDLHLDRVVEVRRYDRVSMTPAEAAKAAGQPAAAAYYETTPTTESAVTELIQEVADIYDYDGNYYRYELTGRWQPASDPARVEDILRNSLREQAMWSSSLWSDYMFSYYYEVDYRYANEGEEGEYLSTIRLYPQPTEAMLKGLLGE